MAFSDFSRFIRGTKVERFAQELAAGKIMGTRCKACGKRFYPPRADCPGCGANDMAWEPLEGRGTLATFTTIYVPPERFSPKSPMPFSSVTFHPCPVGLLEIEGGLRIMGWIPHVDSRDLRVGMALQAIPHRFADGTVTILLDPLDSPSGHETSASQGRTETR